MEKEKINFKFRLGQKVIYRGEETKIVGKDLFDGDYIILNEFGWWSRSENDTYLKGYEPNNERRYLYADESELETVNEK